MLAALAGGVVPASSQESRRFSFTYQTRIGPMEEGRGPVHVFIPLPRVTGQQQVLSAEVAATLPGRVETEPVYGNRFWHGKLERATGKPLRVAVHTIVERSAAHVEPRSGRGLLAAERRRLARFLAPNSRVVVGHEILGPILGEVHMLRHSPSPADTARAIYDWVVDHVEYKKVGVGWGNGDTFWACNERYGNCTDFHALVTSLARSEGIPARFEIGFPVPESRAAGEVEGYHCWVQLYLPGSGWIPIDASEAARHPEQRALFYGTQPTDRIHFTTGRDLRLGADHHGPDLNYFIYPYVEVAGEPWKGPVEKRFSYAPAAKSASQPLPSRIRSTARRSSAESRAR